MQEVKTLLLMICLVKLLRHFTQFWNFQCYKDKKFLRQSPSCFKFGRFNTNFSSKGRLSCQFVGQEWVNKCSLVLLPTSEEEHQNSHSECYLNQYGEYHYHRLYWINHEYLFSPYKALFSPSANRLALWDLSKKLSM